MPNKTNIAVVDDNEGIHLIIEQEFENDAEYVFKFYNDGNKFLEDITALAQARLKAKEILEQGDISIDITDLNLTNQVDVDLIVLDVNMPNFDVIKAVEQIDDVAPMAYVIIISADRDFDILKKLSNMGIFRFCEKDENNFLINLRSYIKAAHRKIKVRKGVLYGN